MAKRASVKKSRKVDPPEKQPALMDVDHPATKVLRPLVENFNATRAALVRATEDNVTAEEKLAMKMNEHEVTTITIDGYVAKIKKSKIKVSVKKAPKPVGRQRKAPA